MLSLRMEVKPDPELFEGYALLLELRLRQAQPLRTLFSLRDEKETSTGSASEM